MTSPREEEAVSRTIELLLDCTTARERSRVLLETLMGSKFCQSAALWRQVGRGDVRAWHPVLGRGSASLLPTLQEIRGVIRGDLPSELGLGRHVLLPFDNDEFALTLAISEHDEAAEEDVEAAESLFQVWLAVEVAESEAGDTELLDALSGPHERPVLSFDSPTPLLANPTKNNLREFLYQEASWLLGPSVHFDLEVEQLPELAGNPGQVEDCLRELLASAAVGMTHRSKHVRVSVAAGQKAAPGALITIEDDAGWIPSLSGAMGKRASTGLFSAAACLDALQGSLRLDQGSMGGLRVTAWLPAR